VDCQLIQKELVAYHFGTIAEEARAAVEEHLVGCSTCVRDFVALKREIETASQREAPSAMAKARLRRAVAAEIGARPARAWWERPLAIACAAAALSIGLASVRVVARMPGEPPKTIAPR
jgi:anti-sigma factor RsiW